MSLLGGLLGTVIGGLFGGSQQSSANSASAEEAQKSRDWQEKMSNSAHSREVEDLKNAGLNPILSASGGNGASTPQGSTAQVHTGQATQGALGGFSAAQQARIANSQLDIQKQEAASRIALNSATAAKELANAEDIKLKNTANYWGTSTQHLSSSAASLNQGITESRSRVVQIAKAIDESQARIERYQAEIRRAEQEIAHSKSDQERIRASSDAERARAGLHSAETVLTQAKQAAAVYDTDTARARSISENIAAKRSDREWDRESQPVNRAILKYFPRIRKWLD